ncbi:HD-GYP domain-containing protein [Novosphingobium piscinae]|uniref:HD-GYP domain-containing protein n=1 Tax=Novosphingobium piscinae TaxID=1507448 RepID=UPI0031B583AC
MQHQFDHQFTAAQGTPGATLSQILGAFSYALDLTEGQTEGHSLRCCWIAMRLAAQLGLTATEQRDIYYAVMLKDLGCSSNSARVAELYLTDDRRFKRDFKLIGTGLSDVLGFVLRSTGHGETLIKRSRAVANILRNGPEIARDLIETRCTRGADIARRLRFSEGVAAAIHSLDEHWDGSGKPQGLSGEAIPLGARLALLAQVVDVYFVSSGAQAAIDEIAKRSGTWLDPRLARSFAGLAREASLWEELSASDLPARVAAIEPDAAIMPVDEDYLDDIAAAFGAVIDAKSPYTAGHSDRVGHFADALSGYMGMAAPERRVLRRAAILHDVGKLGVSSRILEKPGKLDDDEWRVMKSHAMHTTEILGRIPALRDMALIAGSHHERLDGTGYPLQLEATVISLETRIITTCDFFDALTADRPYRGAMPTEQAFAIMAGEAGKAIDPECLAALRETVASGLMTPGAAPLPRLSLPGG